MYVCFLGMCGALSANQRNWDWCHKNMANRATCHHSAALPGQPNTGRNFKSSKNLNFPSFLMVLNPNITREIWRLQKKFWVVVVIIFSGAHFHIESKRVRWDFKNPGRQRWEVGGSCFFPHWEEYLCGKTFLLLQNHMWNLLLFKE